MRVLVASCLLLCAGMSGAQTADFHIQRGDSTILVGQTQRVMTAGVDYTVPAGATTAGAYVVLVSGQKTAAGPTVANGNLFDGDTNAWIEDQSDPLVSFTVERAGTTNDTRFDYEVRFYVGAAGGPNEVIVRGRGTIDVTGTNTQIDSPAIAGWSDTSKGMAFLSAQAARTLGTGDHWSGLFHLDFVPSGGDTLVRATREIAPASFVGHASWVALDFVGSNWSTTQRLEFTTNASTWLTGSPDNSSAFTITGAGGTALADFDKAIIHSQYTTGNDATGLDDAWDIAQLTGNDEITRRQKATAGTRRLVVWLVENTQAVDGAIAHHERWYNGNIQQPDNRSDTHTPSWTLRSMDETSLDCVNSTDGGGTARPRGQDSYQLTGTSGAPTINRYRADTGQENNIYCLAYEWPRSESLLVADQKSCPLCGDSQIDPLLQEAFSDGLKRYQVACGNTSNCSWRCAPGLTHNEAVANWNNDVDCYDIDDELTWVAWP